MNSSIIGNFCVDQEFSCKFAEVSGDFNPLHVDPVMARRYQFGSTVIHGICGVLKALNIIVSKFNDPVLIAKLKVRFNRPIRHNETVNVVCNNLVVGNSRIELYVSRKKVQIIDVEFRNVEKKIIDIPECNTNIVMTDNKALDLDFKDSICIDDEINLFWNAGLMASLFPKLKMYMPANQIAILLGLTRIVGMRCPGMNSVFAGFTISFNTELKEFQEKLRYKVTKSDDRFLLIIISISNKIVQGEIEALFRPKPVQQPSLSLVKPLVNSFQFSSQRALIIGGTRGVGEITAKLIAAGGGHPVISYVRGQEDAQRVIEDITAAGGKCGVVQYNVLSPGRDIVDCFDGESVTHIYYFASPLIEKTDSSVWNRNLFNRYCDFYLSGLADLLEIFLCIPGYRKKGLTVFVPSTIYLDKPEKGFSEYIAAKASTEVMIKQLIDKYPKWTTMVPRLPRMLTDQTSGVAKEEPLHGAKIMLEAITGRDRY